MITGEMDFHMPFLIVFCGVLATSHNRVSISGSTQNKDFIDCKCKLQSADDIWVPITESNSVVPTLRRQAHPPESKGQNVIM